MPIENPNAYYGGGLGVELYDLFTGGGLLTGDVDFYLDFAKGLKGPILELGVGTGRIAVPLAEAGHEIVGVDLSPAMLKVAAAKLAGKSELAHRLTLIEASMTDFDLGRIFSLALIPARSFQHVIEPVQQRAVLERVRRHLSPGAPLILDLFDPNFELLFAKDVSALQREARHPRTGHRVRRSVIARDSDPFRQTIRETLRFEEFNAANDVVRHEETSWTLRWMTREETRCLLELSGFKPVAQFSDFQKSPPAYGREQLWVAEAV